MGGKSRTRTGYFMRDLDQHLRINTGFFGGEFRRVLRITLFQYGNERCKGLRLIGMLFAEILFPIDPSPHELPIEKILLKNDVAHG